MNTGLATAIAVLAIVGHGKPAPASRKPVNTYICPDCQRTEPRVIVKPAKHLKDKVATRTTWILCRCRFCPAFWQQARLQAGRLVTGRMDGVKP